MPNPSTSRTSGGSKTGAYKKGDVVAVSGHALWEADNKLYYLGTVTQVVGRRYLTLSLAINVPGLASKLVVGADDPYVWGKIKKSFAKAMDTSIGYKKKDLKRHIIVPEQAAAASSLYAPGQWIWVRGTVIQEPGWQNRVFLAQILKMVRGGREMQVRVPVIRKVVNIEAEVTKDSILLGRVKDRFPKTRRNEVRPFKRREIKSWIALDTADRIDVVGSRLSAHAAGRSNADTLDDAEERLRRRALEDLQDVMASIKTLESKVPPGHLLWDHAVRLVYSTFHEAARGHRLLRIPSRLKGTDARGMTKWILSALLKHRASDGDVEFWHDMAEAANKVVDGLHDLFKRRHRLGDVARDVRP